MVIIVWISTIVVLAVIMGEIKYHYLQAERREKNKRISDIYADEDAADFSKLSIEQVNNEFVSIQSLSKRGSWRLHQDKTLDADMYEKLRAIEYSKAL